MIIPDMTFVLYNLASDSGIYTTGQLWINSKPCLCKGLRGVLRPHGFDMFWCLPMLTNRTSTPGSSDVLPQLLDFGPDLWQGAPKWSMVKLPSGGWPNYWIYDLPLDFKYFELWLWHLEFGVGNLFASSTPGNHRFLKCDRFMPYIPPFFDRPHIVWCTGSTHPKQWWLKKWRILWTHRRTKETITERNKQDS